MRSLIKKNIYFVEVIFVHIKLELCLWNLRTREKAVMMHLKIFSLKKHRGTKKCTIRRTKYIEQEYNWAPIDYKQDGISILAEFGVSRLMNPPIQSPFGNADERSAGKYIPASYRHRSLITMFTTAGGSICSPHISPYTIF
jgi:hypothetical protein